MDKDKKDSGKKKGMFTYPENKGHVKDAVEKLADPLGTFSKLSKAKIKETIKSLYDALRGKSKKGIVKK